MMKVKANAFDALNPGQRRAATFGTVVPEKGVTAGPLLILAGAGTGKTNTLAHRTAHLVLNGTDPSRIMMLTFTRRAAQEMIKRAQTVVTEVLSDRGKGGDRSVVSRLSWSGTFHSVGSRILRLYAKHLGLDPNFTVLDRADAADLMDVIRTDFGFSGRPKRFPRKDTCLAIYTYRVNTRLPLKQTLEEQFPWCKEWEADLTKLYREYVARKQKNRALDFDDLLLYWQVMMQTPALAQSLSKNFDHVLVDEYQDTSSLQGDIIHALKPDGKGITVVGDDAQAIYSFRAAAVENILGFADRYKAKAEYICGKILHTREIGGSLKRHAILFRSSHHSDVLEVELAKKNIPFVKYGGLKFLEAAHVKDMMSVLRWADNPRNSVAGFRVLKLHPGFGPANAKEALAQFEARGFEAKALVDYDAPQGVKMEWKRFCNLFEKLADPATPWAGQVGLVKDWYKPQLERIYDAGWTRLGDLEQLETLAVQQPNRERFLTELTLDPPVASSDQSQGASKDEDFVILSTIHSAKGQEWDIVYVLNVSDGNFPSEFSTGKAEMIEEERRLLYVAMTRARNELHLCAPLKYAVTQQAKNGDAHVYGAKSRFMTDKLLDTCERISLRNMRGIENLREDEAATVDVVAQLKEMW